MLTFQKDYFCRALQISLERKDNFPMAWVFLWALRYL